MTSSTAPHTVPHPQTHTPHPQTATDIQPAVNLTHLTKSFGDLRAVDGLDLSIRPGKVVAFLEPNGAVKTTTIDMLLGLSRPDEGSVEIFGMPPRRAVALGLVSSVMQTGGLPDDLTVRETVDYTSAIFASSLDTDVLLERAGIADIAGSVVKKCSGGQKQRLRFAMALLPTRMRPPRCSSTPPAPISRSPPIPSKTPSSASPRKGPGMSAHTETDHTGTVTLTETRTTASATFLTSLGERRVPRLGGFSFTLLGLELLRKLCDRRTMIFTMIMPAVFYLIFGLANYGRPGWVKRAMDAGVSGLLVKDAPVDHLADGIRRVMAGMSVIDPELVVESTIHGASPLTGRETDVLLAAADGASVDEVAAQLHLSAGTVRNHLSSAIGKTNARKRADAARIAAENGWL